MDSCVWIWSQCISVESCCKKLSHQSKHVDCQSHMHTDVTICEVLLGTTSSQTPTSTVAGCQSLVVTVCRNRYALNIPPDCHPLTHILHFYIHFRFYISRQIIKVHFLQQPPLVPAAWLWDPCFHETSKPVRSWWDYYVFHFRLRGTTWLFTAVIADYNLYVFMCPSIYCYNMHKLIHFLTTRTNQWLVTLRQNRQPSVPSLRCVSTNVLSSKCAVRILSRTEKEKSPVQSCPI